LPPLQLTRPCLAARMAQLARLLPIPPARLPSQVLRRPELLAKAPSAAARRVVALADALGLRPWTVGRMAGMLPNVMGGSVEVYAAR